MSLFLDRIFFLLFIWLNLIIFHEDDGLKKKRTHKMFRWKIHVAKIKHKEEVECRF